jgi:biopolymer transport protein TolQ
MEQIELTNHMSVAEHGFNTSLFSLFFQADFVVKVVILLLILYSIWSWGIIIEKFFLLKKLKLKSDRFEHEFWSGDAMEVIFEKLKGKIDHPMASVFASVMYEWNDTENKFNINFDQMQAIKLRLAGAMDVAKSKAVNGISSKLGTLGIVSSSAPFIGLFGTVWGIMDSFRAIAASKNATLAVVAPGIAEALFATALGLVAAIPALIAYNYINGKINEVESKVSDFQMELEILLSRELEKGMQ